MTDTDPVPEEPQHTQYGFLARVVGLPVLEERLIDAIEQLISLTEADREALAASLTSLRGADKTIDDIEPGTKKGTK